MPGCLKASLSAAMSSVVLFETTTNCDAGLGAAHLASIVEAVTKLVTNIDTFSNEQSTSANQNSSHPLQSSDMPFHGGKRGQAYLPSATPGCLNTSSCTD